MADPTPPRRALAHLNTFEQNLRQGLQTKTHEDAIDIFHEVYVGVKVLHERELCMEDILHDRVLTSIRAELKEEKAEDQRKLEEEKAEDRRKFEKVREKLEQTEEQLAELKVFDPFETGQALRTCQHGMNEAIKIIRKKEGYKLPILLSKTRESVSKRGPVSVHEPKATQWPAIKNSTARKLIRNEQDASAAMNDKRNTETHVEWPYMVARLLKSGKLRTREMETEEWISALEAVLYWACDSTSLDAIMAKYRPKTC